MIRNILAGAAALFALGAASQVAAQTRYVDAGTLNCRERPIASSALIARLARGDRVVIAETSGDWSRVDRRPTCWVSSRYLSDSSIMALTSPRVSSLRASTPRTRSSSGHSRSTRSRPRQFASGSCPCSGSHVCIGPRGGRYCITSGGNKRYGV